MIDDCGLMIASLPVILPGGTVIGLHYAGTGIGSGTIGAVKGKAGGWGRYGVALGGCHTGR